MPAQQTAPTELREGTWDDVIAAVAKQHGVNPDLAIAVSKQEVKDRDPNAIGDTDLPGGPSLGLFQLRPGTARDMGVDATDPVQNITGGVKYLKTLTDRYRDPNTGTTELQKVLWAYNGGLDNVDKGSVSPAAQAYAARVLADFSKGLRETPPAPSGQPTSAPAVQPAKPPEPSSALSRFGSEALKSGVIEPVTGLLTLGKGLYNDPRGTVAGVARGIIEPTKQHAAAGVEALRGGQFNEAANQFTAAVPLVGPALEQISEEAKSGDVAGAAGRAAGTVFSYAAPSALSKLKATKAIGPVPLLRSERTGSALSQFVENIGERTIPGKGLFREFRARQQQALQAEGERLAQALGSARSSEETGRLVKASMDATLASRKAEAGQLYSQIDDLVRTETKREPVVSEVPSKIVGPSGEPLTVPKTTYRKVEVGGVQPETKVLKEAAIPLYRRIKEESKLLPPQELARTTMLLQRIIRSPRRVPFTAFQDARSDLLRIVRSIGDPVPGKAGGVAKLLAENADDAMMSAAEASGIPQLPELVRSANAMWKEQVKGVFNAPFMKKVAEASSEAVPAMMKMADLDELRTLRQAVSPQTYRAGAARVLRDIITDATAQPPAMTPPTWAQRFGLTPEGTPLTHGPRLQGKAITDALQRLGPERSVELFGHGIVSGLEDLATLADRVRPQQADRVAGGLVAAGINASILAPLIGPILRPTGILLSPEAMAASAAYAATATTSINLLSRLLTRPEGLTHYRAFLRAIGDGNKPLAIMLGNRLAQQIGNDGLGDASMAVSHDRQ